MPEIPNARSVNQIGSAVTIQFTDAEAAARFFASHTVAIAPSRPCREVTENDEIFCPGCGLRWGRDEEKPPCRKS